LVLKNIYFFYFERIIIFRSCKKFTHVILFIGYIKFSFKFFYWYIYIFELFFYSLSFLSFKIWFNLIFISTFIFILLIVIYFSNPFLNCNFFYLSYFVIIFLLLFVLFKIIYKIRIYFSISSPFNFLICQIWYLLF
jgi:hypothetical protein